MCEYGSFGCFSSLQMYELFLYLFFNTNKFANPLIMCTFAADVSEGGPDGLPFVFLNTQDLHRKDG